MNCGKREWDTRSVGKEDAPYPMRWFRFLIYVLLFWGAIANICSGIAELAGWNYLSDGVDESACMYAQYHGLKVRDTVAGVCAFLLAGLQLTARFRLAKFRKDGPRLLYLTYVVGIVTTLMNQISIGIIVGIDATNVSAAVSSLLTSAVMIVGNIRYFHRRKDYFTSKSREK